MTEKKSESLADSLTKTREYQPNLALPQQTDKIDFNKLKTKLDSFKKKVVKQFQFTKVLGILPPQSFKFFEEDEAVPKEEIAKKPTHIIMIIPEEHYKNLSKIKPEIIKFAKES